MCMSHNIGNKIHNYIITTPLIKYYKSLNLAEEVHKQDGLLMAASDSF